MAWCGEVAQPLIRDASRKLSLYPHRKKGWRWTATLRPFITHLRTMPVLYGTRVSLGSLFFSSSDPDIVNFFCPNQRQPMIKRHCKLQLLGSYHSRCVHLVRDRL